MSRLAPAPRRVPLLAAALCTALLAGPDPLPAQSRIAVLQETGTPVIATEILLATGPLDEDPQRAGVANLAARAVTGPVRRSLDRLDAHLDVATHKDAVSFTLTAAPDAWEEATRLLLLSIFRDPVDSVSVVREQRAIRGELVGREANPADAVSRELDAAFFGSGHPWGRPAVGTVRTIERVGFAQASAFLRENFLPSRAVVAVVGPIDPVRARAHLENFLGTERAGGIDVPRRDPSRLPIVRDYNSITTWVAASYALAPEADLEAIRFLTHVVTESLAFSPFQRSVFNATGEIFVRPGGGELRIQVVVPPREASDWSRRVQETVTDLARREMHDDEFERLLRRWRGERMMSLALPEARAREAARQLLVGDQPRLQPERAEEMSQDRLRAAARSLSAPTVVSLGPILNERD